MASEVNYGYRRPMVDMKHEKAMLLIGGKTPPEILRERIESSASVVPDSETGAPMLKVSSFINHQVDCHLMSICGQHLAYRSRGRFGTSKILATKTGALLAQSCALHMRLPLVVALDQPPVGANGCKVYENGGNYISSEFLTSEDRVLVLDLFLSSGSTASALSQLAKDAGANVVGYGFMIEKAYERGRSKLLPNVPVESLCSIETIDKGKVSFQDDLDIRFSPPPSGRERRQPTAEASPLSLPPTAA
mmetsp:Transcript_46669/g.101416  ORF Transcript_46669/g.101416 Transcript_46669/m.101416 type:complete len:248 (-) Transcript_46669:375-1118(-)